jgi:hypothetical protein
VVLRLVWVLKVALEFALRAAELVDAMLSGCGTKTLWLAGCSFGVSRCEAEGAKRTIDRYGTVSARQTGETNEMSPDALARILGSYSAEWTQEQSRSVSSALCVYSR